MNIQRKKCIKLKLAYLWFQLCFSEKMKNKQKWLHLHITGDNKVPCSEKAWWLSWETKQPLKSIFFILLLLFRKCERPFAPCWICNAECMFSNAIWVKPKWSPPHVFYFTLSIKQNNPEKNTNKLICNRWNGSSFLASTMLPRHRCTVFDPLKFLCDVCDLKLS